MRRSALAIGTLLFLTACGASDDGGGRSLDGAGGTGSPSDPSGGGSGLVGGLDTTGLIF